MIDRFQLPDKDPIEVGICVACINQVYKEDKAICAMCGLVHKDCKTKCSVCQLEGCKKCITEDEYLEYVCEECLEAREADYKARVEAAKLVIIPGYYYAGGPVAKDDCTIIELCSTSDSNIPPYQIIVFKVKS